MLAPVPLRLPLRPPVPLGPPLPPAAPALRFLEDPDDFLWIPDDFVAFKEDAPEAGAVVVDVGDPVAE